MSSLWGAGCATFDINLPGVTDGNLNSAIYFAAAMLGLMAIFVARHFITLYAPRRGMYLRVVAVPDRYLRGAALRKISGFKSVGNAILVASYVAVNLILLFTILEWPLNLLSDFGRRLGWVAVANMAFLFFLALKNTPLSFLTKYSFDKLNDLHVIAGYTTIFLSVLHTILFIAARAKENELCNIIDIPQHPGMLGLAAMGLVLISAAIRPFRYELFYLLHIIAAPLVLVGVGLHRPDFGTYSIRAVIFTGAIFLLDRSIRWIRLISNGRGQFAKIEPLQGGGLLITLSKPVPRARPGKFVLLTIGSAGRLQSHPFTIVSINPVTFIINSHAGFTKKLYDSAVAEPGKLLKATLDGPYGSMPRWERYNKVVLIAGGTGASFTFAVALDLLRRLDSESRMMVEFIWVVRDSAKLTWYTQHRQALQSSPHCNVSIYNTNVDTNTQSLSSSAKTTDIELQGCSQTPDSPTGTSPTSGRPDVRAIVDNAVKSANSGERIIVAVCGPKGMCRDVRNATAEAISVKGASVELYVEGFGW